MQLTEADELLLPVLGFLTDAPEIVSLAGRFRISTPSEFNLLASIWLAVDCCSVVDVGGFALVTTFAFSLLAF